MTKILDRFMDIQLLINIIFLGYIVFIDFNNWVVTGILINCTLNFMITRWSYLND